MSDTEATMTELQALRAYYEGHQEMEAAIHEDTFARGYVKSNRAKERLIVIYREGVSVEEGKT